MQSTAISCSKERCPGATEKLVQKQGGKKVEQSSEIIKTERAEEIKKKLQRATRTQFLQAKEEKRKEKED